MMVHLNENIKMDLRCTSTAAFPSEARALLPVLLPMSLGKHQENFSYPEGSRLAEKGSGEKVVGLCSTKTVLVKTMKKSLLEIADKGDPIIVLDFFAGTSNMCRMATKPSLLLKSLENDSDCMFRGQIPPELLAQRT